MIQTKSHKKYLFTPLRYPGGKTSLFEFFDYVIQTHGWADVTYVEPYAGGAGAALSLLLLGKVKRIVINDYDPAIYAFWYSILNETNAFINKIKTIEPSIEEWDSQKQIYKHPNDHTLLELGFATFYLNRTNRSGILNGGGPIGGRSQSGAWKLDARYNRAKLIERIELIASHKTDIIVTNNDGVDVIKRYAHKRNTFMYIDPPYYVQGAKLYLNSFKHEHHVELAKILKRYKSAKWVLTYDNVEPIRLLYKERVMATFSLKYSAHHASIASELVILSDSINPEVLS